MANTAEELEAQKKKEEEAKAKLEGQVEDAAKKAEQDAKKEGLSEAEVQEKVEAARKEEKDKLYPQLEALKSSLKEIQDTLAAERKEKEDMKREADEKEEEQRLAKLSEGEKMLEAMNKFEEQLRQEREERVRLTKELDDRDRARSIGEYRAACIAAAGDEIIPELVSGDSKAEIDKTIEIAKARYAEVVKKVKDENAEKIRADMPNSASPSQEALEEELNQTLAYDKDRYMKDEAYRAEIQQKIEDVYSRAAGQV